MLIDDKLLKCVAAKTVVLRSTFVKEPAVYKNIYWMNKSFQNISCTCLSPNKREKTYSTAHITSLKLEYAKA